MVASSGQAAVDNALSYTSYDPGLCLQWVRGPCWELASFYGSARDAWHGARHKHPGDTNVPLGAPMFYDGGTYGHIVVNRNDGTRMRSTDCTSTGRVSDAARDWPANHWGSAYRYLGWASDLNGVDLPLGSEDDMPLSDEDVERVARRVNKAMGDFNAHGDAADGVEDPEYGDQKLKQIENVVRRVEDDVDQLKQTVGRIADALGV